MTSIKPLRNALFLVVIAAGLAFAQSPPEAAKQTQTPEITTTATDQPEISTQEQSQSFQVKVNLVELRVVVRDAQGNAIGNLKQDDFVLLDDKKPQTITKFSVERNDLAAGTPGATAAPATNDVHSHLAGAWRMAYLFDDMNSTPNDLTNARKAADQAIDSLAPGQLLGIFTLSGQGTQEFTDDKKLLRAAVAQLQPRPQPGARPGDCPPIDYYIADQIVNYNDARALNMVVTEVTACQFEGNSSNNALAAVLAQQAANREVRLGEAQENLILQTFNETVRHITSYAGQRTLVFLSPGFYIGQTQQAALTDSLDRAIKAGVIVSTLDLHGVNTGALLGTDISERGSGVAIQSADMLAYKQASNLALMDPLLQMANATGGKNFRNSNDFAGGLANLSAPPAFVYSLAFSPQNLQNDGKFHNLKVELKQPSGLTVQARKGYFAPLPGGSSEQVKREVAEAVFSHDEIRELPLRVQTQFFKSADDAAHVAVVVHVDVRHMQFKKADGRNLNELTVVAALFDRNDNFVSAKSSTVKMHIKDDTLASKLGSGITVRSNFDVNPGNYLVRIVARDEQGKMLTQNEVVDIP
jgi:VWFA-related protein